ncbi:AraC family transcriptional regulator [Vibrio salinus]|uniref:AraC family transcriptional regulator n=1 Tax=Vibrio salinus TaxID=2899784 RepID=UPI001E558B89|nr:helix-turn-helix domain-containing protein [Vibrio salinus]MCE0495688.1 helix-turn-helix domain-containing protein [Vibrio salinus]
MSDINSLSVRSYSKQKRGHKHDFHQLVLPVRGTIAIEVSHFKGKVIPGECVIVKAGEIHHFSAEAEARFVVADLENLPDHFLISNTVVFSVTPPLAYFLNFIEEQLKYQINRTIQNLMNDTFYHLLMEQKILKAFDPRIRQALDYIENNLPASLSIMALANVACLSPTQFKKLFKEQTGVSVIQYITRLRMEKAQALLLHTDYPIQIVADIVGYTDHAAFSRRFLKFSGLSPSQFRR